MSTHCLRTSLARSLAFAGLLFGHGLELSTAQACAVSVRRNPDPSTQVRLPSGELSGPKLELVREALRGMGCSVTVVDMPWARALIELKAGRLDVLPGAFRLPERESYAWFSASESLSRNRLFVRTADAQRWRLRELGDLVNAPIRIGAERQVSYGKDFDRLVQGALSDRIEWANSRRNLWRMLAIQRVDAVLADEVQSLHELKHLGLSGQIEATAVSAVTEPSHTIFSKATRDAAFVARFDASWQALHKDGRAAEIGKRLAALE